MPPFCFIHILYAYMTPILNNHALFLRKEKAGDLYRGFPLLATAQYAQIKDSIFYSAISCGTSNLYPLPKTVRI